MSKDKLIGHENIVEGLKQSIVNNRISHSYLFQGEESIGKKKLALLFAKTLLCKSGGLEACNRCISCKKFDSQNHPDFWLVEAEKNIIRKEKVDQVIKSVNTYPLESNRKIIIIDSSHKMGIESQNALLKTLEEPPSYMNIILITEEKEQILPTILSRCQIIKFNPVALKLVEEFIVENYPEEADKASFISNFTRGSIGKTIRLMESEDFFQKRDRLLEIINRLLTKREAAEAFSAFEFFKEEKEEVEELLDMMIYWFRDLYIYKELGQSALIVNQDKYSYLSSQSFLSFSKINDIIENIQETKKSFQYNVNYQLGIEAMLLKMQEV